MPNLKILSGPEKGSKTELSPLPAVIGRGDSCDIRLTENSISRRHAVIQRKGEQWEVADLSSQNGLYLDGKRCEKAILSGPTRFRLGNVECEFAPGPDRRDKMPVASISSSPEKPADAAELASAQLDEDFILQVQEMAGIYPQIEAEFKQAIVGQLGVLEELLVAIAANGHCLMIGLPGLAKTLMVRTLADILDLSFKRIQFTPDLMPSDILGTEVLEQSADQSSKQFRFIKGPVFTNMLLADEINRTPPKTQSALLESMQERQVTIANNRFPLPNPFFVLATQNPLEQEGTYPLPEAQLDRFMFNIMVNYPDADEEEKIVQMTTGKSVTTLQPVLPAEKLLRLQDTVRQLPVSRHIVKYATRLARATRPRDNDYAPAFIKEHVYCGAGPRAGLYMVLGAKSRAVMHGRLNVSCEDVRALALPVMRHRIFTNFTADSEGVTTDDLIKRLLQDVEEPGPNDYA